MYTAGEDYTSNTRSVTIYAGSTRSSFRINIRDDKIQENRETFHVAIRLSSSSCLKSLSLGTSSSTVTIIDDDGNVYRKFSGRFRGGLGVIVPSLHDTLVNNNEWMYWHKNSS